MWMILKISVGLTVQAKAPILVFCNLAIEQKLRNFRQKILGSGLGKRVMFRDWPETWRSWWAWRSRRNPSAEIAWLRENRNGVWKCSERRGTMYLRKWNRRRGTRKTSLNRRHLLLLLPSPPSLEPRLRRYRGRCLCLCRRCVWVILRTCRPLRIREGGCSFYFSVKEAYSLNPKTGVLRKG